MAQLFGIILEVPAMSALTILPKALFAATLGVLGRIQSKFRHQVTHVPNLPNVAIAEFRNIAVNRWQPASENWPIARLYCRADVLLSDGNHRPVWYLVEEGMGLAGTGYNVEFCVDGFDRWNVYNGRCRVLR
jgi:capsid protein